MQLDLQALLWLDVPPFASFIDSVLDQLNENSAALVSEQEFFEVASAVAIIAWLLN